MRRTTAPQTFCGEKSTIKFVRERQGGVEIGAREEGCSLAAALSAGKVGQNVVHQSVSEELVAQLLVG